MELVSCPECGTFSPATATECQDCHALLPDETESAPAIAAMPTIGFAKDPEAQDEPPAEPPAPDEPPPFEASPQVLARVLELESAILQKPAARALYLQLAQVYLDGGRKDLAAQVVERCLALDPTNVYLKHRLAQITSAAEANLGKAAPPSTPRASATDPGGSRTATIAFQPVVRPQAAPTKNLMRRSSRKLKLAIAGGLAAIALVIGLKMWLFPSTRCLVAGNFRAFAPAWSPTGKHIAFLMGDDANTRIAVYDFASGAFRAIAPASAGDSRAFSWSPDGSRLAYAGPAGDGEWESSVFVVDAAGGQPRKVAAGTSPVWTPDGQTLIMVCMAERPSFGDETSGYDAAVSFSEQGGGERYCRVNVGSGQAQRTALGPEHGAALSPLQEALVFERSPEGAVEAAAGAAAASGQAEFDSLVDNVTAGRASNVGEGSRDLSRELEAKQYAKKRAAAMTAERLPYVADVFVADLGSGAERAVTSDRQSAFPSWTADGERILFATNGAAGLDFCTVRPDGSDRQTVLSGWKGVDPSTVTLSPDGRNVFFVAAVPADEGLAKIMTGESPADLHVAAVGSKQAKRLSNRHPFKQRYAVSPDGKRIVYEVLQDVKLVAGAGKSELWLMRW